MAATVAQTTGSPGQLPVPPVWTPQMDKLFEKALAIYDNDSADRWEKIAAKLPGFDAAEVQKHYDRLIEDLNSIENGRVALPNYHKVAPGLLSSSDEDSPTSRKPIHGVHHALGGSNPNGSNASSLSSGKAPGSKASDPERRKGIPWSEEEHRLFLLGLAKFGKGDWRSISRNFVISRTPTQVASHAQKYFIRLNSINNKDKRRSSIHDITSVNDGESLPQSPGPITGLPSPGAQWPRGGLQAGSIYDMGGMGGPDQVMAGQMLMTPSGHPHHVPYGHVPVMQGPPMSMQHMSYPMPQSANA